MRDLDFITRDWLINQITDEEYSCKFTFEAGDIFIEGTIVFITETDGNGIDEPSETTVKDLLAYLTVYLGQMEVVANFTFDKVLKLDNTTLTKEQVLKYMVTICRDHFNKDFTLQLDEHIRVNNGIIDTSFSVYLNSYKLEGDHLQVEESNLFEIMDMFDEYILDFGRFK
jgi:hypothetical protein